MYSTYSIKEQWKKVFCCGNPDSKEVILILGSCRVVPYLNYLHHYNETHGNRFKIYAIDPINYQVDINGAVMDTYRLLKALETHKPFLEILKSVTIFIHEGLSSFGILNTLRDRPVNAYQFGLAPQMDISLANFHDCFLLFKDFAQFNPALRGELTEEQQLQVVREGDQHIERFCNICLKSSFPEFGAWFREHYLTTRLFHSFNHVSSAFTTKLFQLMNDRFLQLELDDKFWETIGAVDMYANISTPLCSYDLKWRPYSWPEPIGEF